MENRTLNSRQGEAQARSTAEAVVRRSYGKLVAFLNAGTPPPPAEPAEQKTSLNAARQALTNTLAVTAWLEGWAMPVEIAVEAVLMPEAASATC